VTPSLRYTHAFVRAALPEPCHSLLEVGCGNGELAQMLRRDGFEVVAIDSDPDAVQGAVQRGVDARLATWPTALDETFDAILFTRSLHHIHDLKGALDAAVARLRHGGRIIVEDFRAEGASDSARTWFAGLCRLLHTSGALREGVNLAAILDRAAPNAHEHELHSSDSIRSVLARRGAVGEQDAAYFFRYLEPEFVATEAAQAFLDQELSLIRSGALDALGKRFVLSPRP
jgi:SAM-dependent methyltransferase